MAESVIKPINHYRMVAGDWNPGFTDKNQEKTTTIDLTSYNFTHIHTIQATIVGNGYTANHYVQIQKDSTTNLLKLQAYSTEDVNISQVRVNWLVIGI
jgi:hypothetical protein